MSNKGCLIGFPNKVDEATLSGGSFVPTLPLNNLKNRLLGRVARTTNTDLASTKFTLAHTTPQLVRIAALVNHNMSLDAQWRIRCSEETTATNLLLHTEEIAAWEGSNVILASNVAYAPDGTANADRVIPDTKLARHYVVKNTQVLEAGRYTMSVFVRPVAISKVSLSQSTNATASAVYDFINLTAYVQTGVDAFAEIKESVGGWFRISLTYGSYSSHIHAMTLAVLESTGQQEFTGFPNNGVHAWGAQLEVGNSATSYYPAKVTFTSRASTGSYVDSAGITQIAAVNTPRLSYNPRDIIQSPSLIVEDASTNFITGSSSLVEGWSGCTIVSTGLAYLGLPLWRVGKASTGGSESRACFARNMLAGESINLTFVVAGGNSSNMSFSLYDGTGGTFEGTVANTRAEILKGPGVLTRVGGLFTVSNLSPDETTFIKVARYYPANGSATVYFYPDTHNSSTVGKNILLGRVQCELGIMNTSYIPTTTAAVTRAKDIVSLENVRPTGFMDDWQSYTSNSGYVNVWPSVFDTETLDWESDNYWSGVYSTEQISGYTPCAIHIFPNTVSAATWKIDISDVSNTSGFVQIGRVFLGPAWSPTYDAEVGLSLGWESATTTQTALSGTKYFQRRNPYRVTNFTLNNISVDEALEKAFELDRMAGIDKEVFWVQSEADTAHALRRRFLGTLRQMSAIEFPHAHLGRKQYQIEEVV